MRFNLDQKRSADELIFGDVTNALAASLYSPEWIGTKSWKPFYVDPPLAAGGDRAVNLRSADTCLVWGGAAFA